MRSADAPPTDALAQSMVGEADTPAPDRGPYDLRHAPADVERLDFGGLQIPAVEGVEVRVQANPDGMVEVIVLVEGDNALQLGVFAAPRTEGIWDEVRDEIAAAMAADGVQPKQVAGPYGMELTARVQTPDGPADCVLTRSKPPKAFPPAVTVRAIAGTAPYWAMPAPQRLASGMTASQTHWPLVAMLLPRSLGTSAQPLYALTVR